MGVFARLGAVLGSGAAHVELAMASPQVFRGSIVRGEVVLEGGRVPQRVRMVSVDLYEYWISGHGKNRRYNQRREERVVLGEYIPVEPGFRRAYEYVLHLPDDARCTRRREGWEVRCEAHIPWSVDPRSSTPLRVLPHAEVLAVQRAARDLLGLHPLEWDGRGREVMYNFRAPAWLKDLLDGVRFHLWVDGDRLEGKLDLNKQERGVRGALGALVGADHENISIAIPRSELLTKRGSPNPAGAYEHLKVIFERLGAVAPPPPVRG